VGKALAALLPSTAQNSAASLGSHPLHEAVFARTLAFFWLIGSFWHEFILPY